jgi:hypothetical protein
MRNHLAAVLAVAILLGIATAPSAPAAAADAKSEASALINDLRDAIEGLAAQAEVAAKDVEALSIAGSTRNRDVLLAKVTNLAGNLSDLDTKLRALDLKVSSLSAPKSSKSSSKSSSKTTATSTKETGNSSSAFRVTCEVGDRSVGVGATVTYTAVVSGGSKPYSYSWEGAFKGNSSSQKVTLIDKGTYKQKVTVTDKSGRISTDECPKVEVDNAFADGVDDDTAKRATDAKISILEPSSSAKLVGGQAATIRWKGAGLASGDRLDIYLQSADGLYYYVATSIDKGEQGRGTFVWPSAGTIASEFVPYKVYTLKVCTTDGEICGATKVTLAKP